MSQTYTVGIKLDGRRTAVKVDGEDALVAALKVKQTQPRAVITYVRKHNARGDQRHEHPGLDDIADGY